ncbi:MULTISPECIES: LysE family transporter [Actinobacillus]|uniref:LysE family transporter n=4 Tax=Actinobacillus TaxID=713 RepID=A0A9X4JBE1_ACTEU|nr:MULTISPECIES: LysE family transporter [Actinobacillus]AFU19357.1 threonine efflux protein [Actinobacillus suis H91-0380]MCQ9630325.1 LysE family transporter [Actinobacillus suis]MCQ9632758.1 LysE family transporter [Actinobacillus suis]MCQ9712306.1 LysE family transporter [Actinobacillus suis]MDE8033821.1 LysE family transporter [Actinobacillus equuli subsp. equuli]
MLTILLVHLAGLASPGPDFFYVVRQSASHSTKAGILAAIGISLGIIFWASFAIFGLAWLSNTIGTVFQFLIMVIGGIYLSYIGSLMVRVTKNAIFTNEPTNLRVLDNVTEIKKGLLINIFNAKAGVYFTSVVSAFLAQFTQTSDLFLLLFLFVFSTLIYFILVALLFSRRPIQEFYTKYSRYIDNVAGVIFILFGMILIFDGIKGLIS